MELKRTILAVALSLGVLVLYNYYLVPKKPRVAEKPAVPPKEEVRPAPQAAPAAPAPLATGVQTQIAGAATTQAVLESDLLAVKLTSRGAAIEGIQLKRYKDRPGPGGRPVEVLGGPSGVDLVGDARLVGGGVPLGADFAQVVWTWKRFAYAWDSPSGLRVEKVYSLQEGQYEVDLSVQVRNRGSTELRERLGLAMIRDYGESQDSYSFSGPAFLKDGNLVKVKLKEVKKGAKESSGEIAWAAFLEKYFLVAAIPGRSAGTSVRIDRHGGAEKVVEVELDSASFDVAPGGAASFSYRIYAGPKLGGALAPLGANLDKAIDYGWFHAIAKPLLTFLKWIYSVTGNYGVAIIILTALVKAAFWPLSARSYRSMQKMKDLQPRLQKLKERYGKDRERLNMEVMQLYKTHKVNPLGGCLPMLLQIPVFFALYRVLLDSIELRQAPFMLWIQDLSAKDPYYVTPLVMGATMFLQQKMTPATGTDEMQMKIMMYGMPLVFTFMFLNFPSGLVVYWLVNNILSIGQQAMMMRQSRKAAAG